MIISTAPICDPYDVIDTIMFFDTFKKSGFLGSGGYDFDTSFADAKRKIAEIAAAKGGDAVINCDFELRVAVTPGIHQQVFELFCFGTVVKLRTSAASA